jgi:hypothetical protein
MKTKTDKKNKKTNPARRRYPPPEHTWEEMKKMEVDYVTSFPAALITNIPDKAYKDEIAAKQIHYDTVEIISRMVPDYKLGKKRRKNMSDWAKLKYNAPDSDILLRNKKINDAAVDLKKKNIHLSILGIAKILSNSQNYDFDLSTRQIRRIILLLPKKIIS